ncbi:MAG TPA: hypothetical protein VI653_23555 [Steroidobacteraceae bacterium]
MHLSLVDAFGRFGSKPYNRTHALSAIATDGAMVLNCSPAYFGHPVQGVLRYEDRLSREVLHTRPAELLGQHLTLARDGALPVRMVVTSVASKDKGAVSRRHVRADLIGKVVMFDGDHFIVDFTRQEEPLRTAGAARRVR